MTQDEKSQLTWTTRTPTKSGVYIGYNGTPLRIVRAIGMDGLVSDIQLLQEGWGELTAFKPMPMLWKRYDADEPTWVDIANANLENVDLDKAR